ncbi:MAG: PAS domain-containing sensor histidine kinase [Bacteroidota bacterium]
MGFKNFKHHLFARIGLLVVTIFIFSALIYSDSGNLSRLLILGLVILQGYNLYLFLGRSEEEISAFLERIQNEDLTDSPKQSGEVIYPDFEDAIDSIRELRSDREAQHQYLKTIVQHVTIGIITFEPSGEVQIFNSAAKSLLGINQLSNINDLKKVSLPLVKTITELRTGGRDLVRVVRDNEETQIAVYAIELSLKGETFKLISLQNIQSELEEKEMDAWQNLIRVLTHEIMNSVTPISSLAKTLEGEIKDWFKKHEIEIQDDELEDFHLALHTIYRRSDNLIAFVSEFRNMTRITLPNLKRVPVKELIDRVLILLKYDIGSTNIKITLEVIPENLMITLDENQVEQVFINLIKNAVQALQSEDNEIENPEIKIKAHSLEDGSTIISVEDNGPGIDEEALEKIFIPFFTTKKGGSGIGLTLSKQIMRLHNGTINVKSKVNEGTTFTLKFIAQII